jgi:hypothetical protein
MSGRAEGLHLMVYNCCDLKLWWQLWNYIDTAVLRSNLVQVYTFFGAFSKLSKAFMRFMSVLLFIPAPNGPILIKFHIWVFFRKYVGEIKASLQFSRNNGCFTWRRFTFMTSSRIFRRTRNISSKSCRENQNTHFINNFVLKIVPLMTNFCI